MCSLSRCGSTASAAWSSRPGSCLPPSSSIASARRSTIVMNHTWRFPMTSPDPALAHQEADPASTVDGRASASHLICRLNWSARTTA
jgi:hypothetical protein